MEFVILGLLLIRQLTQYDIKQALEKKISPFYSASLGSIQAALKKLESNGHVDLSEVVENGRRKKIYTINSEGKQHFMSWMLSPFTPHRFEQDAPTRLFFFGFMTQEEKISITKAVVAQLKETIGQYEDVNAEASGKDIPEYLSEVVRYQLVTLELGLYSHKSMLIWFEELLRKLEEGERTDE